MAYGTVNVPPKEKEITVDSALSSTSTNPVQNKVVQAALALKAALNHVHTAATTTAAGFMSAADKVKLDGIAAGANKYTHPAYTAKSAGLYKVTVDSTGHVSAATAVAKADITALGIPAQNTVYTHPTTSGNKHIPSGGSSGQILRWSADGTAVWGADNNTTYSNMKAATASAAGAAGLVPAPAAGAQAKFLRGDGTWQTPANTTYGAATTSAAGLMSADDKKKLDALSSEVVKVAASCTCTIPSSKSAGSSTLTLNAVCDYVVCGDFTIANECSNTFTVSALSSSGTTSSMIRSVTVKLTGGKTLAVSWGTLTENWLSNHNLNFTGYKYLL